jgi:hypothetical protein
VAWLEDSKRPELSFEELRTSSDKKKKTQKAQDAPEPIYTVTRPNPLNPDFVSQKFTCELPCIKEIYTQL